MGQSPRMGRLKSRGIAESSAGVAQLAEQRTRNAQVRGSSPRSGSNLAFEPARVGESGCSTFMTARLHTYSRFKAPLAGNTERLLLVEARRSTPWMATAAA